MNKADLTRWSWVEIDRGALRRNTRAYKNLLNPRQRLCCVVKADAYGHGAVECAKIMYSAGADMFAVATEYGEKSVIATDLIDLIGPAMELAAKDALEDLGIMDEGSDD